MAQQLKSFKRDWKRWTSSERAAAIALLLAIAAAIGGPLTLM